MGFFDRLYYGKAGKRDYSEMDMPKNRVSLFFLVLKDHFFDLIKVNFLQLIFWIPCIIWTYLNIMALQTINADELLAMEGGISNLLSAMASFLVMWLIGLIPCIAITGPSTAGAAYIMRNWARDQHAFLLSDFKDAFKGNWKQALFVSVVTSCLPVLAYTSLVYYGQMSNTNALMIIPMVIVLCAMLIWALMLVLIYPMMIGYELSLKNLIRNSFLLASAALPKMLLARIITLIPLALLFVVGVYMGNTIVLLVMAFYYVLFGYAFTRLVYASIANGVFDKYLNPRIEGAAVGLGLRPQSEEDAYVDDDDDEDEDYEAVQESADEDEDEEEE